MRMTSDPKATTTPRPGDRWTEKPVGVRARHDDRQNRPALLRPSQDEDGDDDFDDDELYDDEMEGEEEELLPLLSGEPRAFDHLATCTRGGGGNGVPLNVLQRWRRCSRGTTRTSRRRAAWCACTSRPF